jgi:hypothetical protein
MNNEFERAVINKSLHIHPSNVITLIINNIILNNVLYYFVEP